MNIDILDVFKRWSIRNKLRKFSTLDHFAFNRLRCMELFNLLDSVRFRNFNNVSLLAVVIKTNYIDIDICVKKIVSTNNIIMRKDVFPVDWNIDEYRYISLDRFLTADGYYVDIENTIYDFKKKGLKLCKLLEESDTADFGLAEYNKRMLTKMLSTLCVIVTELVEVSI